MDYFDKINNILIEWDPMQVGEMEGPVQNEYITYIPRIKAILNDRTKLIFLLEHILTEEMGLSYDPENPDHKNEVIEIAKKMCNISL